MLGPATEVLVGVFSFLLAVCYIPSLGLWSGVHCFLVVLRAVIDGVDDPVSLKLDNGRAVSECGRTC